MNDSVIWKRHITALQPIPTGLQPTGEPNRPLEAIFFDIYGTLFISASGDISLNREAVEHRDARLAHLLKEYGIQQSPARLNQALFNAIEQRHLEMKACGIRFPEVEIDRIWKQILGWEADQRVRNFAMEYELIVNPIYPMPHLAEMLATCRQVNLPMGIISNAQFYTPYLFEYFLEADTEGLGFNPDLTIYSFRTGHGKPSPYLFDLACRRLAAIGLTPDHVLFVGNDMRKDIYPAHQAGFQTALFAGDQRSLRLHTDDPRCVNVKPDMVIIDLAQLGDHILPPS